MRYALSILLLPIIVPLYLLECMGEFACDINVALYRRVWGRKK